MRARLGVLLLAVASCASVGAGDVHAALGPCSGEASSSCGTLTVPLDRSGAMPGTVKLAVARVRAARALRPPILMIPGGPGESATWGFEDETPARIFGGEARFRDVIAMDLRGTWQSGLLRCPALQRGSASASDVAACAERLGPPRDFYTAVDTADDIDAVRGALGVERLALYGVGYGTHVALTYARRYPGRVDRLVLDSTVPPEGVDAFARPSMAAVPRVARALCGERLCRRFTSDAGRDIARLATRLDRRPLRGLVTDDRGRRHKARIDGAGLLRVATHAWVTDQVPGAVHSALRGDPAALLRVARHVDRPARGSRPPRELNVASYYATLCSDLELPWGSSTPVGERMAEARRLAASLPVGSFAPFGPRAALASHPVSDCRAWPSPARQPPVASGPLPDVPALLLAGELDLRTPLENAHAVAAQLPRAKIVTVGRMGHGVLGWDLLPCARTAARDFLAGGDPGGCGSAPDSRRPFPPAPTRFRSLSPAGGATGRAGRTARAVQHTIADFAIAAYGEPFAYLLRGAKLGNWLDGPRGALRSGALRGGAFRIPRRAMAVGFERATVVPGVRVDGMLRGDWDEPLSGVLRVSGPAAAPGLLRAGRRGLRGSLGGKRVRISYASIARL